MRRARLVTLPRFKIIYNFSTEYYSLYVNEDLDIQSRSLESCRRRIEYLNADRMNVFSIVIRNEVKMNESLSKPED